MNHRNNRSVMVTIMASLHQKEHASKTLTNNLVLAEFNKDPVTVIYNTNRRARVSGRRNPSLDTLDKPV